MRELSLTQGKVALVDDEDYERVSQFKWCADKIGNTWYACRDVWPLRTTILLHRFLLDAPDGMLVDHENMDGLDCRRSNLRLATRTQNGCNRGKQANNTSGYKGVTWHKQRGKWVAQIHIAGRHIHLGLFDSVEDAAVAYDEAAPRLHGAFARTNTQEKAA